MVIAKGEVLNPTGRPAGVPNKSTSLAREAIARFVDNNADRLTGWLDAIATVSPQKAFECYMSVVEYHIPKLARSEIENKMSISFEPLVIERTAPAPMLDVTPTQDIVIEAVTTSSKNSQAIES